jgi:hypothetical protein
MLIPAIQPSLDHVFPGPPPVDRTFSPGNPNVDHSSAPTPMKKKGAKKSAVKKPGKKR